MTTDQNKTKIRSFILRFIQNQNLSDETDIFATGYVNSMFAMQLVLFVEKQFGIVIGNEDLELANFSSVKAITELVERKTKSNPSA
ncbi:MAG: acyl carrier protein [Anaerolineae bacterium]|nr:acyl carrier protein [Anaerolineae bacterium]